MIVPTSLPTLRVMCALTFQQYDTVFFSQLKLKVAPPIHPKALSIIQYQYHFYTSALIILFLLYANYNLSNIIEIFYITLLYVNYNISF